MKDHRLRIDVANNLLLSEASKRHWPRGVVVVSVEGILPPNAIADRLFQAKSTATVDAAFLRKTTKTRSDDPRVYTWATSLVWGAGDVTLFARFAHLQMVLWDGENVAMS